MLTEKQIELLTERLVERIQEANIIYLNEIGKSIKLLGTLTPTKAQQLVQILKYGDNYQNIIRKISKLTNLNAKEINEIFLEFAKKDQSFYKQFYEYRKKPFIPLEQNKALRNQVIALANITKKEMVNFTRSEALGYSIRDKDGNVVFSSLRDTYDKVIDQAILNVGQGKESFDSAMHKILKEIGTSGLKTMDYESGRSIRLDSMVRQHLQNALRNLHNENQKMFGKEFDANGVEISVHLNPAPDHQEAQGQQLTNKEFEKLQETGYATTINKKKINMHLHRIKTNDDALSFRQIGNYNCYHNIFPIILGISKPRYSQKELNEIIKNNNKGFEFEGKHYTMYEGTQLQRQIEREIRKQKDLQILGKSSNNIELIGESQRKITQLNYKYKQLSKVSGLPRKAERMLVANFKKVKVDKKY